MNSTPSRCSSIMRLTALPPPPPTPTTFMRAFCGALSSNSKIIECEAPELRYVGPEYRGETSTRALRTTSLSLTAPRDVNYRGRREHRGLLYLCIPPRPLRFTFKVKRSVFEG